MSNTNITDKMAKAAARGLRARKFIRSGRDSSIPTMDAPTEFEIDDARAALEAAFALCGDVDMEAWQQIETAPKDGSVILFADPDGVYCVWFVKGDFWFCGSHPDDYYSSPIVESRQHAPTHWRHLPLPPAKGDGE